MRRSPFYAYPTSYPFQHRPAHTFFAPSSADNLHHPNRHHGPFPFSASPSDSAPTVSSVRPIINIPVHDPSPKSSPVTTPAAPLLDPASAAIRIQSCFRGFSIRRHRPLLHLRAIVGARKQLEELKLEFQDPEFADKVRASDKERLRFTESVMAVILHLDSIQGSIPEVRSQRKEATKMAINLQDAIDAITMVHVNGISDSQLPTDPDTGMTREEYDSSDCKQTEESLIGSGDSNIAEGVIHTALEGGQTSVVADAYAAPTSLVGLTSPIGDMAGKFLMMDIDKISDVVDEGVASLPLKEAEDVGPQVVDSVKLMNKFSSPGESGSQDVSAEALNATDYEMCIGHGDENRGCDDTCAARGDVNSDIHADCAHTNDNSVLENIQPVAMVEDDPCVEDDTVGEHASGKDAAADRSHADAGVAAEKHWRCHHNTNVDARKPAPDQLSFAPTPQDHVHGASTLGDCLLDKLTSSNCSSQGTDPCILFSHGEEKQGDPRFPTVSTVGISESMLLQQLLKDCRQLKSVLGKVLAHSKAQSKVICALGDKLETLEHQQQLNFQNSRRKACEKRKLKKRSKRSGKVMKQCEV